MQMADSAQAEIENPFGVALVPAQPGLAVV
jgi:hypothetical protein